jgi:hypothetical protein
VTYRWKDLDEGYNFALDLMEIKGLHKKLCACKGAWVPILGIWDSHLGIPKQKAIWMWPLWRAIEYIINGKVVASPEFGSWWVLCVWVAHGSS